MPIYRTAPMKLMLIAMLLALSTIGCEEGGDPKKSGDNLPDSQIFNGNNGCLPQQNNSLPPMQQGGQNGQQQFGQNNGNGFQLQDAVVTYEADIKPILKARCFDSCHNGSNANASSWQGADGALNYTEVAENKRFIADVVSGSGTVTHNDPINLSTDEIAKFKDWETAGFPRGEEVQDPVPGNNGNPAIPPGGGIPNPCTGTTGQTSVPGGTSIGEDALDSLINSELHKKCLAAGTMTDRKNDMCLDDVPLDMSWCNDAGIKAKFDELAQAGQLMAAEITKLKGQGFEFEGCGVQNGSNKPYVSWLKRGQEGIHFHISVGTPPGG